MWYNVFLLLIRTCKLYQLCIYSNNVYFVRPLLSRARRQESPTNVAGNSIYFIVFPLQPIPRQCVILPNEEIEEINSGRGDRGSQPGRGRLECLCSPKPSTIPPTLCFASSFFVSLPHYGAICNIGIHRIFPDPLHRRRSNSGSW